MKRAGVILWLLCSLTAAPGMADDVVINDGLAPPNPDNPVVHHHVELERADPFHAKSPPPSV